MSPSKRPVGLLFDVGGVCVVSPFQAILDYEIANKVPIGWVNYSIQHTSPDGAWHRLERGEIKLDADFFAGFHRDFRHQNLWQAFNAEQEKKQQSSSSSNDAALLPLPTINAERLFWELIGISQSPDPYMFPALEKLKASGQFIMGALSNTTILPEDHEFNNVKSATVDVQRFFEFYISSAHCGLRKPDPRIYALALKEMNDAAKKKGWAAIEADDIVFLDDIGVNLKWAKRSGFRTIKVDLGKTKDAVRELERVTGLQLLDSEERAKL